MMSTNFRDDLFSNVEFVNAITMDDEMSKSLRNSWQRRRVKREIPGFLAKAE